jgi:DNA-binding CsgD family transcriptional regulator
VKGSWPSSRFPQAAARAVAAIGFSDFYDHLLSLVGTIVPHDLAALVRYTRSSRPDLILPRVEPTEALLSYSDHFYAHDPFHMYWRETGEPGVQRLRSMSQGIGRTRYAREFLRAMAIHDEIAVFLPPVGDAAPTLILDRAEASFSGAEVTRVREIFPFLASLHRRHVDEFVARGLDHRASPFGSQRPLRLVDRSGELVFATDAWRDVIAAGRADVAAAIQTVASRGPCILELPDGRQLQRVGLPADFGAAPSGFCDEVFAPPAPVAPLGSSLPDKVAQRLTARERDVVLLTLQGYPIVEIARRLSLSRGTVKNHRLSIYRKLDITTERELFGECLAPRSPG